MLLSGSSDQLKGADLAFANLTNTQMYMVDLRDANLNGANLGDAFLRGAFLKDANLRDAGLLGANLSGADLHGADSSDARLKDANLSGADLSEADLSHAKGMSNEELEQETSSLGRATMPDGQRHKSVTTEFVTTEFEPAFSISLSEEWEIGAGQERSHLISISNPDQGELFFTNPLHVFDPSEPSAQKELPAPENAEEWLSWFQRHPNLDTSKPVPVRVGSASGKQIDVTYASTPENFVELYPLSDEIFIAVYEGYKDRFVIVDVQGETVLIDVGASPDKFDEFFPKAQKVLDTVEWKGE